MVLKANDRRTSCPCHDEFRGPRSDCVRQGTGSNSGESMDVCKCIVPLWHGGTLSTHRAASSLMRLVEGEEIWEASDHPGCSPSKLGWNQAKFIDTGMMFKSTANRYAS
ncbi:hypothetical protein TNCV_1367851 [Trichonephila clavipes]|nr:hypothetical protein TNCV_1367851 [Trichonephila clavipes]